MSFPNHDNKVDIRVCIWDEQCAFVVAKT